MKQFLTLVVIAAAVIAGYKLHSYRAGMDADSSEQLPAHARTPAPSPTPTPVASVPRATPAPEPAPLDPSDIVKTHRNDLVFVSGSEGAGSGFIATFGGANFLFTNAHVAAGIKSAGFKTLEGTAVQTGAPAVAVGHDIFRMQLAAAGPRFELMQTVEQNATIGDEVVVLGNAEGAGVINTLKGKIIGIGPNLVETDAPFQSGNSGSPIVHLKSGKVVGVATYLTIRKYDTTTRQPVSQPVIRRFGYRLDSVKAWQPVNWSAFLAQAAEMQRIEKLTDDLALFLGDLGDDSRVSRGRHTNPVIKTRIDAWLDSKNRHMSQKDLIAVDQNFISFMRITSQSDIAAARQRLGYDFFQRALSAQQQERAAMSDIFGKIINELQKIR